MANLLVDIRDVPNPLDGFEFPGFDFDSTDPTPVSNDEIINEESLYINTDEISFIFSVNVEDESTTTEDFLDFVDEIQNRVAVVFLSTDISFYPPKNQIIVEDHSTMADTLTTAIVKYETLPQFDVLGSDSSQAVSLQSGQTQQSTQTYSGITPISTGPNLPGGPGSSGGPNLPGGPGSSGGPDLPSPSATLDEAKTEGQFFEKREQLSFNSVDLAKYLTESLSETRISELFSRIKIPNRQEVKVVLDPLNQIIKAKMLSQEMTQTIEGTVATEDINQNSTSSGVTTTNPITSETLQPYSGVGTGTSSPSVGQAIDSGGSSATVVY